MAEMAQERTTDQGFLAHGQINVTPAAEEKLRELFANRDPDVAAIRIFVMGGGCHGMRYSMTFAEVPTRFDKVLQWDGFTLFVDTVALNYLDGVEIDFGAGPGGRQTFIFNNVFQSVGGSGACSGCAAAGSGKVKH